MKKDFVDAYINRGDVLIQLNRSNEALEEYRKAIHHGPTNTMAFFNVRQYACSKNGLIQSGIVCTCMHAHTPPCMKLAIALQVTLTHLLPHVSLLSIMSHAPIYWL